MYIYIYIYIIIDVITCIVMYLFLWLAASASTGRKLVSSRTCYRCLQNKHPSEKVRSQRHLRSRSPKVQS